MEYEEATFDHGREVSSSEDSPLVISDYERRPETPPTNNPHQTPPINFSTPLADGRHPALSMSPQSLLRHQRRSHPDSVVVDGESMPVFQYALRYGGDDDDDSAPTGSGGDHNSNQARRQELRRLGYMSDYDELDGNSRGKCCRMLAKFTHRPVYLATILGTLVVCVVQCVFTAPLIYQRAIGQDHRATQSYATYETVAIECLIFATLLAVCIGVARKVANRCSSANSDHDRS